MFDFDDPTLRREVLAGLEMKIGVQMNVLSFNRLARH
jgi:hypothetical protein